MLKTAITVLLIGCCVLAINSLTDGTPNNGILPIGEAEARVGRPLTPVSVAGVARRTSRRVIRRTTYYVATLPAGCTTVVVEGTTLYFCGGTYYQSYGGRYVIVEVD